MKKQFLLLVMIIILCVCFCTLNGNRLQACDANAAVCTVIKTSRPVVKEAATNNPAEYVEETDMPANYFMNPFIPM